MKKNINLFKNKLVLKALLAIILASAIVAGYIYFHKTTNRIFINNSVISSPSIVISPSSAGKVRKMEVKEGQYVQIGDELAVVGSEVLRADTDGLITSASDLTGSTVGPQTQLIQMIRPANIRVAGTVDEDKGLSKIKVGQTASFTVDALPGKTFWGYVDEISASANTPVFSFSTSTERNTQQFTVYVKFDITSNQQIKNGMSAKLVVYTLTH